MRAPSITLDVRNATNTTVNYRLLAGADASSQANELYQDVFEFTDNYSYPIGAHTLTVGTQNRFFKTGDDLRTRACALSGRTARPRPST